MMIYELIFCYNYYIRDVCYLYKIYLHLVYLQHILFNFFEHFWSNIILFQLYCWIHLCNIKMLNTVFIKYTFYIFYNKYKYTLKSIRIHKLLNNKLFIFQNQ